MVIRCSQWSSHTALSVVNVAFVGSVASGTTQPSCKMFKSLSQICKLSCSEPSKKMAQHPAKQEAVTCPKETGAAKQSQTHDWVKFFYVHVKSFSPGPSSVSKKMVVNDESPVLRSRASLIQRCSSETANTHVLKSFLVWSAESRSCRESQKSQEPQGSAKLRATTQPMAMWDRSRNSHPAFVDEIINKAPDQRNLLAVTSELCACHCRITQVTELAPEIRPVLMTF